MSNSLSVGDSVHLCLALFIAVTFLAGACFSGIQTLRGLLGNPQVVWIKEGVTEALPPRTFPEVAWLGLTTAGCIFSAWFVAICVLVDHASQLFV